MEHVYASLDIGSDSIKIVVCEQNGQQLNLLAATSTKAEGIKKDLIHRPEAAIKSIKNALKEIESMLGVKLKKVITTIPSYQIEYKIIKSAVKVNGDTITKEDIKDVYKEGLRGNVPPDKEFVNIIPIDFQINDKAVMKNPKGFPANKLFGRAMLTCVPKKNVYSVASVLESIGIEIVDVSVASVGDIYAFRDKITESSVGAIINIGSDITSVSLYNKGIPVNTKIINMGGKDIDGDLAFMYKLSTEEAKKIKEKFALANLRHANIKDIYETNDLSGLQIKLNQKEVSEIVMARIEEILTNAKNEIKHLTNREIQYIIVTGGTSNAMNIETTVDNVLGHKASIGKIKVIGARNNKYSVALGNLIYFIENKELKGGTDTMLSKSDMETLSSPNKHFINTSNDTMLGKVFGYFFGE